MISVGIDLGTTNSVVAIKHGEKVICIPCKDGTNILPSVVTFNNESYTVGDDCRFCENSIISVKRHIGNDSKFYTYSAQEISSFILKQLYSNVLEYIKRNEELKNEKIGDVVITVPAYFDDIQRVATKTAASLAGIKVLKLLNEPTAAAIAYGFDSAEDEVVGVYDLGGGTFDFSILNISSGVFQVLATAGDAKFGGDDIDEKIAEFCCNRYGVSLDSLGKTDRIRCIVAAKELKEKRTKSVYLCLEKYTFEMFISDAELKNLIYSELQRTKKIVEIALDDADLCIDDLNNFVLVGGMTKSKEVKSFINDNFKCKIFNDINPDEAVAIGAAIHCDSILTENSNNLLIDVIPLSLGIETLGGGVDRIIVRNTPIPFSNIVEYTTSVDSQTAIAINIVQGESDFANKCRVLGKFVLNDIPLMKAGEPKIYVKFSVDINGILHVTAREENSNIALNVDLEPAAGLSESSIIDMLKS